MPVPCWSRRAVGPAAIAVVLAACCFIVGRPMPAEEPAEIDPTGGLRSRGAGVPSAPAGISREELVRQWDLDGNGTIDASEAAVAKARMKRTRMEMELGTTIDPLTGKPRALVTEGAQDESTDGAEEPGMDESNEPRPRAADAVAPPGSRVPVVKRPVPTIDGPRVPASGTAAGATPVAPRPSLSAVRPGSVTGGVRAGAPAARSGYGSLVPKPDLNAGLPRPVLSGTRGGLPRGGFLPTVRSPALPRPGSPAPPPAPRSRVSADEIGGY